MTQNARPARRRLLLTGASGFVGRHLRRALSDAGWDVRAASRDPDRARPTAPELEWVRADIHDPQSLVPALTGCQAAVYLVHSIGERDYARRERAGAEAFREAAERAGVSRIVYLGGVSPQGRGSTHLSARLETGATLRSGRVSAIELRAGMIVGSGSASWQIVRRLAERLPAMILPAWLRSHSWPVCIDDVVRAIVAALDLPLEGSAWFELPGPERLSHRQLLERTAQLFGRRPPMLEVPFVSPRLSSFWVSAITGVRVSLVRELIEGIRTDLDPTGPSFWDVLGCAPTPLEVGIRDALRQEILAGAQPEPTEPAGAQARRPAVLPGVSAAR